MLHREKACHIEVTHLFRAGPALVYGAWLTPEFVKKWFGPGLGTVESVVINATVGGSFRIVQIREGQPVGHSGSYIALEHPKNIAFTWATDDDEGHDEVHISIEQHEKGSVLRLVHTIDARWKQFEEKIHQAWLSMLQEMELILTSLKIVRHFNAPPDVVFDTFTKPDSMRVWWHGNVTFNIDLKLGGQWTIVRKEDDMEYTATGTYIEIRRPNFLSYTYAMPQFSPNSDTISIQIEEVNGGSLMTFRQSGEDIAKELEETSPEEKSASETGWLEGFDLIEAAFK